MFMDLFLVVLRHIHIASNKLKGMIYHMNEVMQLTFGSGFGLVQNLFSKTLGPTN